MPHGRDGARAARCARVRAHGRDPAPVRRDRSLSFEVPPRHVYVHVPFCARRCTYCDFSIAVRRVVPADEYADAVGAELAVRFPEREPWEADTLYLGGGTPSRLGGAGVARVLDVLRERITPARGAEITIEANPEDITADAVRDWRGAGVNRLSIGSQSFDDRVLAWMHRTHDAAAIVRAVHTARDAGIANLSLDLIFALPRELERAWRGDLEQALALDPDHLSLYGLTIEPHTPLGRAHHRGQVRESPDERYEEEFLLAHDLLLGAGMEHYEVSNFGKPGRASRHNSAYWSGAPYAGIGPSAHEFDGAARRWNTAAYAEWLRRVGDSRDPVESRETLTAENRLAETVYLGLRTRAGLGLDARELHHVEPWIQAGWATLGPDERLRLTPLGWLRLDALAADLTHVRSRY
ncbi:MAG TPA: radical SAM family heme chaperone HemW [Gemmatimonadaceae bacterium]|nr:radical SAM family heme chaperone HemW [Gemmatimonadaceae bacterium]